MENPIIEALFSTHAIRVCQPDQPFWYTSGTLGPFYINTHFLYENEISANELLLLIEEGIKDDRQAFPAFILRTLLRQYETSRIFRLVTDTIVEKAKTLDFDFISGGERRDFFFSILPAYLLKKPHLTIFKDATAVYSDGTFTQTISASEADLSGKKALHIADLVTEASSYTRAWIPVVHELGGVMKDTIAIVDRAQGGEQILLDEGVKLHSFARIDLELFARARDNNDISAAQFELVATFMANPKIFMQSFLEQHPTYIQEQLALGGKAKERAETAIAKGLAADPSDCMRG